MVGYNNLRPTTPDSLRRALQQARITASEPFGQKIAGPTEGITFYDTLGQPHPWDGPTIAAYDARMAEATTKAQQAQAALAEAQQRLEEAEGRINATTVELVAAKALAEDAQKKAEKADLALTGLDSRLGATDSELQKIADRTGAVEAQTGQLSGAVENALSQASAAGSTASQAAQAASAADAKAQAAQTALSAANAKVSSLEAKAAELAATRESMWAWPREWPTYTKAKFTFDGGKVTWTGSSSDAANDRRFVGAYKPIYSGWFRVTALATNPSATEATVYTYYNVSIDNGSGGHRYRRVFYPPAPTTQVPANAVRKLIHIDFQVEMRDGELGIAPIFRIDAGEAGLIFEDVRIVDVTGVVAALQEAKASKLSAEQALTEATLAKEAAASALAAAREADAKALSADGKAQQAIGRAQELATQLTSVEATAQALLDARDNLAPFPIAWAYTTNRWEIDGLTATYIGADTSTGHHLRFLGNRYAPVVSGRTYRLSVLVKNTSGSAIPVNLGAYYGYHNESGGGVYVRSNWPTGHRQSVPSGAVDFRLSVDISVSLQGQETGIMPVIHPQAVPTGLSLKDPRLVDITEVLSTLSEVESVRAQAVAASTQAQDAMRVANLAQDSANGKSTMSYTTGTPSGVGTRIGDTHYQVNASGTVLRWWRWSGSAWVPQALSGLVIDSIDAGKITSGYIDVANRVKAGAITTNHLTVGIGPNLFPPLSAEHITGAINPTQWRVDATGGLGGVTALVVKPAAASPGTYPALDPGSRARVESPYFIPVQPGQQYRVSVWVKGSQASTGSQTAVVYGRIYGEAGGTSFTWASPSLFRGAISTSWTQLVGYFTVPEDTGSGVRPTRLVVGFYTSGTYPGECWFSSPEVMAMTPGDLIVNGSITGQQINSESVAAAVGQFVQVKAQNVEVTRDFSARVVNAMDAALQKLVVSREAILNHSTLLGTTVAEQLNVTKLLKGRDAILDGTVDVNQLNVTVAMSAAVVNAMDTATKRLVVTEDAILQRATVIQSLVTPQLIAEKVDARYARLSDLEAGNLTMTGTFRSGRAGAPGVVIPQNYTTMAGKSQLGVWLTYDGAAPGTDSASIWGATSGLWIDQVGTSSTSVTPLHIRGQRGGGVRVWGGLTIADQAGNGFISPYAGGEMTIRSYGHGSFTGGSDLNLYAGAVAYLGGTNGVVLKTNGNIAFRGMDNSSYSQTFSGGGLLNLVLGSGTGRVYVQSSSLRFKTDVQDMGPDHEWLNLRTVWYRDKESVRVAQAVHERWEKGDATPLTAEEAERLRDSLRLTPGRIAEEASSIGASQVIYDQDGVTPLSYDYSRDGVMLIPHVREHRDKLAQIENRIKNLEERITNAH